MLFGRTWPGTRKPWIPRNGTAKHCVRRRSGYVRESNRFTIGRKPKRNCGSEQDEAVNPGFGIGGSRPWESVLRVPGRRFGSVFSGQPLRRDQFTRSVFRDPPEGLWLSSNARAEISVGRLLPSRGGRGRHCVARAGFETLSISNSKGPLTRAKPNPTNDGGNTTLVISVEH
jgi:hypothetical protein